MKCPLLIIGWNAAGGGEQVYNPDCHKEDCAWWSKAIGACSMLGLETSLSLIGAKLMELVAKMPH